MSKLTYKRPTAYIDHLYLLSGQPNIMDNEELWPIEIEVQLFGIIQPLHLIAVHSTFHFPHAGWTRNASAKHNTECAMGNGERNALTTRCLKHGRLFQTEIPNDDTDWLEWWGRGQKKEYRKIRKAGCVGGVAGGLVVKALDSWLCACEFKSYQVQVCFLTSHHTSLHTQL